MTPQEAIAQIIDLWRLVGVGDVLDADDMISKVNQTLRIARSAQGPNDRLVTVCAACRTASCWHGEFLCDNSEHAGTTDMPVSELQRLNLEHPDNWTEE